MNARSFSYAGVALAFFFGMFVTDSALGASAPKLNPLEQIIEGAKAEGTVSVVLLPALPAASMKRLREEIRNEYGVNLDIKFTPSDSYPKFLSMAVMEQKAGVHPSYDLHTFSPVHIATAIDKGLLEKVDWSPLLMKGTPAGAILGMPPEANFFQGYGVTYYHNHSGLIYNSKRIPADRIPQTFADLADPKLKGQVGLADYPGTWVQRAFIIGKEKTFSTLRQIMKNKVVSGTYSHLLNSFLIEEISIAYVVTSGTLASAREKNMPTGWATLDFSLVDGKSLVLRKGARHPNAAKLLAAYLVSQKGYRFLSEEAHVGNLNYPGNIESEIGALNEKMKVPTYSRAVSLDLLKFTVSQEAEDWGKEIALIFQGR